MISAASDWFESGNKYWLLGPAGKRIFLDPADVVHVYSEDGELIAYEIRRQHDNDNVRADHDRASGL